MRPIKFRGKRLDYNKYEHADEWVYGGLFIEDKEAAYIIVDRTYGKLKHHQVDIESVGQFSGLYDKDGKEIYEGDILKNTYFKEPYFHTIKYGCYHNNKHWDDNVSGVGFYIDWDDDVFNPISLIEEQNCIEIIGNIHDKPLAHA